MEKRFLGWSHTPIGGLSISASGLLALADLTTIAKRTALTGTSSWWDVLVLAPGIHYQQAAENLALQVLASSYRPEVTNLVTGDRRLVTNVATIHYLDRVGTKQHPVTLDVGGSNPYKEQRRMVGKRGRIHRGSREIPGSKLSNLLYVCSPLLTITALVIMIITQDWWGVALIGILMVARALNVYIIQSRSAVYPPVSPRPNTHQTWWINLDDDRCICLRGLEHDLEAITTGVWMRSKTNIEGYLEAMAKLAIYMVGVLSGNMYQTGDITLIVLLLCTSGLLALSNAHNDSFNMNGRSASVTNETVPADQRASTVPLSSPDYQNSMGDFEKQEAATVIDSSYPFSNEVNYV